MDDQGVLLFSYGTLRLPGVQLAQFGRTLDGWDDILPGYTMGTIVITDPGVVVLSGSAEHPAAVFTGDPAAAVSGTVFAITGSELLMADEYEVDDYTRVEVALGSGKRAWVYVCLATSATDGVEPDPG